MVSFRHCNLSQIFPKIKLINLPVAETAMQYIFLAYTDYLKLQYVIFDI